MAHLGQILGWSQPKAAVLAAGMPAPMTPLNSSAM
jgi:hypothetical protein